MSYSIRLEDPVTKETIQFDSPHQCRGGTYAVGGTTEAWLNITYNYSEHYSRVFDGDGIRTIYGLTGSESIPVLEKAISKLGDTTSPDYWESTEGNAKRPLFQLLSFAQLRPDGIWNGD